MQKKSLSDLEQNYELELDRIVKEIKKQKAKRVLLQLPDGFKIYATEIQNKLQEQLKSSNTQFFIWLDTCFGACDLPLETEKLGIDLIVQFGHTSWDYSKNKDVGVVK
jgi:2-(3-amino-3-carboxypropyl)histidine synthase